MSRATFQGWATAFGAHYTQLVVAHQLAAECQPSRSDAAVRAEAQLQARYESLLPQLPVLFTSVRSKLAQLDATVALLCSRGPAVTGSTPAYDEEEEWVDVGGDHAILEPSPVASESIAPDVSPADEAAVRDALRGSVAELRRDATLLDDAIALLTRVQSGATRGEVIRDAIGLKSAISAALKTARSLLSGDDGKADDRPPAAIVAPVTRVADASRHHTAIPQTLRSNVWANHAAGHQRQNGHAKRQPSVRDRIVKKLARRS